MYSQPRIGVDRYLNQPKFLPVTICSGETYLAANATAYTVSGTYTKLNDGCNNQELVLTVTPKPTKVSTQ
jgi:hypothetical protein